ncbi:MAG: hypothetical protein WA885_05790 [Phormidesmis sp.]
MQSLRRFVSLLFLPAGLGLLLQATGVSIGATAPVAPAIDLAHRLLALALALFCAELARMAGVDLDNIARLKQQDPTLAENSRLRHFHKVTISTIVLEITGFYAALRLLPVGAIAIIFSQLWFNLLAGIQLYPNAPSPIETMGPADRKAVLLANAVGLSLMSLWFIQAARIWLSAGLLSLIVLFLLIKYGTAVGQPAQKSK